MLLAPLCKNIEWPAHLICRISNRTLVYFVVGLSQDLLKQFNVGSCKLRVRIYFAVGKRAREQRFHFFSSWSRRFHTFTASRPACTLLDTSLCNQTLLNHFQKGMVGQLWTSKKFRNGTLLSEVNNSVDSGCCSHLLR